MPDEDSSALGRQLLAEFHGCAVSVNDAEFVRDLALEAAALAEVTVLHEHTHRFSPHGLSTVLVLAESHLALHTWPEHNFLSFDLFTCGDSLPTEKLVSLLKERLQAERVSFQVITRGQQSAPTPVS